MTVWLGACSPILYRFGMDFAPHVNYFDLLLLTSLIAGGAWGYWRGGVKSAFKLACIVGPSLALAYFGNDMVRIGNTVARMLGEQGSVPLGVVGAMGGVLGIIGLVGAFFIGSQFLFALLHLHKPEQIDKTAGVFVGSLGFVFIGVVLFIFSLKTFPSATQNFLQKSYAWPYARPTIVYAYPTISGFIDRRMAGLVNGLSGNNLIARIALGMEAKDRELLSGNQLADMMERVKNVDFKEVVRLQQAANKLDPEKVQQLIAAYKSGDMSEARLRANLDEAGLALPRRKTNTTN